MIEDVNVQEIVEPEVTDERTDPDEIGGDEGKDPVPYDRFKEVNDLNREFKQLGYSPGQIAERMAELGVLKKLMAQADDEPKREPKTDEEKQEAYQKAQAKKLILELFPHLAKAENEQSFSEAFREANATEAWFTTIEVMEEAGMDVENPGEVRAVSSICKEIIEGDPRLFSKYLSGKADQAVKGAFKKLRSRFGESEKKADPRPRQIRDKKKLTRLTKQVKGGTAPDTGIEPDKGAKDLDDADARIMRKLETLGQ